jgi:hypothetical protein
MSTAPMEAYLEDPHQCPGGVCGYLGFTRHQGLWQQPEYQVQLRHQSFPKYALFPSLYENLH